MLDTSLIAGIIESDYNSKVKAFARKAEEYYNGHHDIDQYKVCYYDAHGVLKIDNTRSNIRISHPFFSNLVDQEVQYMLSGKKGYVFSDKPELQDILDENFNRNDSFNSELYDVLTGCIVRGKEYMYCYIDEHGKVRFHDADSIGIIEVRPSEEDDVPEYLIRWYIERISKDGESVKKIEVWDKNQTYFYVQVGKGSVVLDENRDPNPRPHTLWHDEKRDNSLYYDTFGFIPFFCLKNNAEGTSGLAPIKSMIDDYDLMNCSLSNNLQDLTEGIYVVKGFEGDRIDELIANLKEKKAIGVGEGGDVDIKTVSIPYEARKTKMEIDEENIYRFGMGFNPSQIGDGNVTNVVIKSRYALLDLKCNKLEIKLKEFLAQLVKVVLDHENSENGTGYSLDDVRFEFEREVITNASDNAQIRLTDAQAQQTKIGTILNLQGTLPDETLVKLVCKALDIKYEDVRDKLPQEDDAEAELDASYTNEEIEEILGRKLTEEQIQKVHSILLLYRAGDIDEDTATRRINEATNVALVTVKKLFGN